LLVRVRAVDVGDAGERHPGVDDVPQQRDPAVVVGASPQTWSPVNCMAPYPIRPTVRPPPIVIVPVPSGVLGPGQVSPGPGARSAVLRGSATATSPSAVGAESAGAPQWGSAAGLTASRHGQRAGVREGLEPPWL
jgi:hypothetical protein